MNNRSPKIKANQKGYRNFTYYLKAFLTLALFTTSPFYWALPTLANTAPGTTINNTATGSFEDPDNLGTVTTVESNTVSVTVAEVAGITISQAALPEEAPSGVSGAGGNQGDGNINPDDIIYFTYKITNVGNDPTQFFIPDAPSSVNNGSLEGNIQIIEYDPDGASAVDLTTNNITVPSNGDTTGSLLNGVNNTNDGSVPVGGSITIRVPVKADSGLADGDAVTVIMGDTPPNDNSAATQNQVYSANAENKDVYTQDNSDGTTGETNGNPINGDATNHRQEASFSQEVAVTVTTALGQPFVCDSSLYMVIGDRNVPFSQLNRINRSTNPFTFDTIGPQTIDYNYNALAYNPVDNYLYAIVNAANPNSPFESGEILKIGSDGVPVSLGKPQGDAPSYDNPNSATFLADGTYVIARQSDPIYTIDVTTTPPTSTLRGTVTGTKFEDIAINPYDTTPNRVYGIDDNTDKLVYFDFTNPGAGATEAIPGGGTTINHNHGSQFYDLFGNLLYRSATTDALYIVNPDGTDTFIANTPDGGSHDGASCFAVGLQKEVNATDPVPAGQKVTYTYKIGNSSDIAMTVTLTDDLRSVSNYPSSTDNESETPVNGNYTGVVNTASGTVALSNSDQTLTISNISLAPQQITEITAEVTIPESATPETYYNQATITGLPPGFVNVVKSDYPTSPLYEDPTPVEVTEPLATNPNVLLVKRITKINNNTTTNDGDDLAVYKDENTNPYDDNTVTVTNPNPPATPADTDNWPDPNTFLIGGINGGKVEPDDELEYTIYYLSAGDTEAENVLFCDRVPGNVSFIPTSFNGEANKATGGLQNSDRGIQWLKDGNTESLTNVKDGDVAQYFPPGVEPSSVYPKIKCDGTNTNGAVVVNLGNLPNATAPGTPNTSYGFVRFRGKVK